MADWGTQIADFVDKKLNSSKIGPAVIEPAGIEAVRLTKRNTREGRGFADYDFGSYAPSTQKRKKRSTVTFRETGATINSLFHQSKRHEGTITFSHNDKIMDYHQEGSGRNPKREIFPEKEPRGQTIEEFTRFVENKMEVYLNAAG